MLDDGDAGHAGGNRLELAANLDWRVRLHIERVNLGRPAVEIQEDARLGSAFGLASSLEPRFLMKQLWQRQAKYATGADMEEPSAGQLAGISHRRTPRGGKAGAR